MYAESQPALTGTLAQLPTPALLLDRDRLRANARRLAAHIGSLGCVLRPHVKTHKCVEVARDVEAAGHTRGITVSTLREAEFFFDSGGYDDIFYAVGLAPNKFARARALIDRGCRLSVTLDSCEMAGHLADFAAAEGVSFPSIIELDTDGHRAGVDPDGEALLELGRLLHESAGVELAGVMTHAGESYNCDTPPALLASARQERDRTVAAAARLRAAGLPCPVVSIGSTPTAFAIDDLAGVTEVRAGVYSMFDLVMANIGVCTLEDIALSVLVTVTGYQRDRNRLITDGGWMALSRDRGTASQRVDYGYGAVLDAQGRRLPLLMSSANQEHGIISPASPGQGMDFSAYPLGSQLRVLPNHACATAGQYEQMYVMEEGVVTGTWKKTSGW
jgi:D-serine deaminase-like pyridoxal phosphate-dependent protein